MIRKLLIANRGEIAVRIIRAAKELGIRTVAVFSDADANSIHKRLSDEAVHLGAPDPAQSYLNAEKVIKAAKERGADAIHPGYGFLAERAEFADAVAKAGLIWVGPPASAMRKLGAKIDAKKLAVSVGVPVTPGYFEENTSPDKLLNEAKKIGFPVMLKASGGGGGRGLRVVEREIDFASSLKLASDEAKNSFGDGQMMVEKLVKRPRHVEVQILADSHGNVAALFERECSIQRRHQKLIEECPSPLFEGRRTKDEGRRDESRGSQAAGRRSDDLANPKSKIQNPKSASAFDLRPSNLSWESMRDAAISLSKAAGYVNAGTVEFMVDEASGEFYFLEVNARLQVEHPVTEAVTEIDLVKWQLRIASGETLDLPQPLMKGDRGAIRGHAIEARIVAEDPSQDFRPGTGRILGWAEPRLPGIRVDTGFGPGSEISGYYDSLIAKVIAHGDTREDAIDKLRAALLDFHVLGVPTNVAFALDVLDNKDFRSGKFDTGFLEREYPNWKQSAEIPNEFGAILQTAASLEEGSHKEAESTAWSLADGFRNA